MTPKLTDEQVAYAATGCSADTEFPWPEFIALAREVQEYRALRRIIAQLAEVMPDPEVIPWAEYVDRLHARLMTIAALDELGENETIEVDALPKDGAT